MNQGTVFNVQHFSVHDGPGIRTVVFLKGCPLRCQWCANPESQKRSKQLAWNKSECIGCGGCVKSGSKCNFRFEEDGLYWEDRDEAEVEAVRNLCPAKAMHVLGETKSVEDVIKEVEKDSIFYDNSYGGMTISGGEPLSQPDFTIPLLREAKRRGIHCAIESCGYADEEVFKEVAGLLDYLLMDIKSMNDEIHREYTGVSNKRILENFKKIRDLYPELPILIRTPVIPGVNDNETSIKAIHDFIADYANVKYELLKYHKLGEPKYKALHREYPLGDRKLDDAVFDSLKKYEFNHMKETVREEFLGYGEGI